jgi:adenylylsulfate kinase
VAVTSVGRARAILVCGPVGVGKTVVAAEVGDLLAERGVPTAVIDLDWLGWLAGGREGEIDDLILRNLAATWPNFEAAGAERLVLARSVRDPGLVNTLRSRFDLTVVRLTAPEATVAERLRGRDAGAQLAEHLGEPATEADGTDVEVANDGRAPIREVAESIVRGVGWA